MKKSGGETATHELERVSHQEKTEEERRPSAALEALREDDEEEEEEEEVSGASASANASINSSAPNACSPYTSLPGRSPDDYLWRIDLAKTEPYWRGWFSGMSQLFLGCNVPKLLLLAGVDRLDKDLTIGQMQGKFQMQVLPQSGHAVHEDAPDKVAESVANFLVRNKFADPTADFHRPFPCC